jgi:hypothetical protein
MVLGNLGWLQTQRDDPAAARILVESAVAQLLKAQKMSAGHADVRQALRSQYLTLAEVCLSLKDPGGALAAALALAQVETGSAQDCYYAACFLARAMPLSRPNDQATTTRCRTLALDHLQKAVDLAGAGAALVRLKDEARTFQALAADPDYQRLVSKLPHSK